MPIGNVSRDTTPKRENYRPPWVKNKDSGAPPAWMTKRLKPVEVESKAAEVDEAPTAAAAPKTLKPALKKQTTIRDKSENGIIAPVEEKLLKPTATKLTSRVNPEEKAKFTKSALKSLEKIPKLEDKLSIDKGDEKPITTLIEKSPERPTLRTVRTIDDKAKEKSVTIVDKKGLDTEKSNSITKPVDVDDKPTRKVNSFLNKNKPINKTTVNDKAAVNDKTSVNDKAAVNDKTPVNNKPKFSSTNDKPNDTKSKFSSVSNKINEKIDNTSAKDTKIENKENSIKLPTLRPVKPVEKPKAKEEEAEKEPVKFTTLRPVKPVEKPKVEEKVEEPAMATKPPTSKLPPRKPSIQKQPSKDDGPVKKWRDPLHERVKDNIDKTLANEIPKGHTLTKNESLRSLLKPTPPPMPPPLPPKMPPPPEFKKPPLEPDKLKKLEQLRSRPRRRPDWSDMMKEVEQGKKLKKVVCNDRSSPIIARTSVVKNKGQFIFESEKPNSHNELLKEINLGVKLKKVKTNDRSKPNLEGLRKFRRQMTIEEQVQKSMSQANLAASPSGAAIAEIPAPPEEDEIDEMDDIDKVRDDLQSTKQLLAIELRNKEAQERENKRLQTRIHNLEAELARERAIMKQEQHKTVISVTDAYDERLVNSLKLEIEKTKENADHLEKKYLEAAEERDQAITELEEMKRLNAELEKKLQQALQIHEEPQDQEPMSFYRKRQLEFEKQCRLMNIDANSAEAHSLRKCAATNFAYAYTNDSDDDEGIMPTNPGSRRSSHAIRQLSVTKDDSFEEEDESEPEEEESEEKKQKRLEKEVRNMRNKIIHLKQKQDNMKRERMAYKMALKNQQAALKDEKQKYKELKREVSKMAAMMKEVGSGDDEDEEEEEEESDDSKKSESEDEETETETEQDTESETESESEPEDAPLPKKKENLSLRVKRHETRVNALKKGNALLQANVDRLKDDVLKQREESMALKKELDSLIEDLE